MTPSPEKKEKEPELHMVGAVVEQKPDLDWPTDIQKNCCEYCYVPEINNKNDFRVASCQYYNCPCHFFKKSA